MAFSATHAALEGFRLIGRRPFSVLAWAIVYALAGAALFAAAAMLIGPTFVGEILRHHHDPSFMRDYEAHDLKEVFALLGGVGAAVGVLVIGIILLSVVQLCAVFRAVLRPEQRGFAYMRLGGDELRQVVLMLILGVVFTILCGGLVLGLMFGLKYAELDTPLTVLLAVIGGLAIFAIMILVSVRLSLAQPMTFAQRRLNVFGSWGVTRGHFWPLLGMYVLAAIFCIIVYFLGEALARAVGALLGFTVESLISEDGLAFDLEDFTFEDLAGVFGYGGLAYIVISMISSAMQLAIGYAPQAAAYRDLTERDPGPDPEPAAAAPSDDHGAAAHGAPHGDDHGGAGTTALAAAGAAAAGAALAADQAHASDHDHADPLAAHRTPLPPAADAHAAPAEAAFPAADDGHAEPPAADHGHAEPGHAEPGHADAGHGEATAEPHAEPAAVEPADQGQAEQAVAEEAHPGAPHDAPQPEAGHHDAEHGGEQGGHEAAPAAPADDHGHPAAPAADHPTDPHPAEPPKDH